MTAYRNRGLRASSNPQEVEPLVAARKSSTSSRLLFAGFVIGASASLLASSTTEQVHGASLVTQQKPSPIKPPKWYQNSDHAAEPTDQVAFDERQIASQDVVADPERNSRLEHVYYTTAQRILEHEGSLFFTPSKDDATKGYLSGTVGSTEVALAVQAGHLGFEAETGIGASLAITRHFEDGQIIKTELLNKDYRAEGRWTTSISDVQSGLSTETQNPGLTAGPYVDTRGAFKLVFAHDVPGGAATVDAAVISSITEDF